jgi:hypothetical protein
MDAQMDAILTAFAKGSSMDFLRSTSAHAAKAGPALRVTLPLR